MKKLLAVLCLLCILPLAAFAGDKNDPEFIRSEYNDNAAIFGADIITAYEPYTAKNGLIVYNATINGLRIGVIQKEGKTYMLFVRCSAETDVLRLLVSSECLLLAYIGIGEGSFTSIAQALFTDYLLIRMQEKEIPPRQTNDGFYTLTYSDGHYDMLYVVND